MTDNLRKRDGVDMAICERLKLFRESLGVDQKAFAKLTGTAFRTYQDYELGNSPPKIGFVQKFAEIGGDPTWLLTGQEPSSGVPQGPARTEEAPPLDIGLLSSITGMLEEWLERHQRRMEPNQRGRFIAEAYAFCMEETQHSQTPAAEMAPRVVERFLRLVS
ncbi:helix-turn-helix transcriptional regulator [Castellaniella sp.]|uniref:helix-turn-helix domain-containing protein n=1 Tax=Castellaniella sp. TaxID=1955812 RepID=UPI002AFE887B|nr:helix-turn-helix transcriptional regulator [Castellaniella sp.]